MGDFNLDLLNCDSHLDTDDFLTMKLSNFFLPTHFLPSGKSTLIDNSCNSLEYKCTSGNFIPHVTDHLPNFLFIKNFSSQNRGQNKKQETYLSLILLIS